MERRPVSSMQQHRAAVLGLGLFTLLWTVQGVVACRGLKERIKPAISNARELLASRLRIRGEMPEMKLGVHRGAVNV